MGLLVSINGGVQVLRLIIGEHSRRASSDMAKSSRTVYCYIDGFSNSWV